MTESEGWPARTREAHDVGLGVCERADESDGFVFAGEGKEVVLIAQEDGGLGGDLARGGALLGGNHLRGGLRWIAVGVLEEAELVFGDEDVADGVVDGGFGDEALLESLGQGVAEGVAGHLHVDASVLQRGRRRQRGPWRSRGW